MGHRNFITSGMHCSGKRLKNRSVVLITTMSGCDAGSSMFTFYCAGLLWYHIANTLLYTNPVILYYSENMCTNQEATSTSDMQAVKACTCTRTSEPTTVL